MPSDAKVPDPQPRGITVPAGAVVVLVLTGAIWGVGLFLLGRQTAPPVEVLDRAGEAHVSALNRIDQAIAQGNLADATAQLHTAVVPNGPIGKLALDLRQVRIVAEAADQVAKAAEAAAKREAAAPQAVLKRLQASLWQLYVKDPARLGETSHKPIQSIDVPLVETTADDKSVPVKPAEVTSATPTPAVPSEKSLPELILAGERFVPDARITHPTIAGRAYALHPRQGLLRSEDGGKTWRVGLGPLQRVTGSLLSFTSGDLPLLQIWGREQWVFADTEAAFFP